MSFFYILAFCHAYIHSLFLFLPSSSRDFLHLLLSLIFIARCTIHLNSSRPPFTINLPHPRFLVCPSSSSSSHSCCPVDISHLSPLSLTWPTIHVFAFSFLYLYKTYICGTLKTSSSSISFSLHSCLSLSKPALPLLSVTIHKLVSLRAGGLL